MRRKEIIVLWFFLLFVAFMGLASSSQLLLNVGISNITVNFDLPTETTLCSTPVFSQQIENMTDEILGQYKNYFKVINRNDVNSILNIWKMRQMGLVQSTQTVFHLKPLDIIILVDVSGVKDNLYFTYKFLHLDGTEAFPTKGFTINNVFTLNQVLSNSYAKVNSIIKDMTSRIEMKVMSVKDDDVEVYTYGKNINIGDKLKVLKTNSTGGIQDIGEVTVKKIISTNLVECSKNFIKIPVEEGDICVLSKDIVLKISTDNTYYSVGDDITINISSNEDCYLYIFDLKDGGKGISLLFPIELYAPLRDNFIRTGETLSLPYYKASEPIGTDKIVVFGSYMKLENRDNFASDFQYYRYVVQTLSNEKEKHESSVKIQIGE